MRVEEKASRAHVSFQFDKRVYCNLTCSCPKEILFAGNAVRWGMELRKVLLTPDTPIEVRIGGVLWWVMCNVFFVLLLLVDYPVGTNDDWR
jgi:hypothetical protein